MSMEVPQIDEIRLGTEVESAEHRKNTQVTEPEGRKCIYKKDTVCSSPDCKMQICEKCPYGAQAAFGATLKDVFKKIVGIAIFIAKSDDVVRDVIALMGKNDAAEGKGMEQGQGIKDNRRQRTESAGTGKADESAMESFSEIRPVITKKLIPSIGDLQRQMKSEIGQKVSSIDEALANSQGENEAPLV